jgi:predicted nucleic-acid-binding Zn-ribbon protein
MSIWHEITQGVQAVVHPGPGRFVAAGLPVHCPHCQGEDFIEGSALLSTVGMSFAHLNWATEKKVTNLMCDKCGLIQWFGATPHRRNHVQSAAIGYDLS